MTDAVWMALVAAALGNGQPDAAEFVKAYQAAALRWEDEFTRNIEIKATATTYDKSGRADSVVKLHLMANDRCRMARRAEVVDGVEREEVWHLLRPDGYYVIHPNKTREGYYLSRFLLGEIACHSVPYPLSVFTLPFHRTGRYLPDSLAAADTRILADTRDADGTRRVRAAEKFGAAVGETEYQIRPDDYTLDGFRVVASAEPDKLQMRMFYKQYDFGTYPERMESHLRSPGGGTRPSSRIEFTEVRRTTFQDSEFSLRKFGLPESVQFTETNKQTPLYLWLLLAAGVCGLLAVGLRYLARSRAPSP